jgi:hypothetical protein
MKYDLNVHVGVRMQSTVVTVQNIIVPLQTSFGTFSFRRYRENVEFPFFPKNPVLCLNFSDFTIRKYISSVFLLVSHIVISNK